MEFGLDKEEININLKISSRYLNEEKINKICKEVEDSILRTVIELYKESYPVSVEIDISNLELNKASNML